MSVVLEALGADAERLHPQLQRRFGASTGAGYSCVGRGVMDRVWHGPAWTVPFLQLGAWRHILVPVSGEQVPFTVENHAYVDAHGRESLSVLRTFEVAPGRRARFDATLVAGDPAPDGRLGITSGAQRFYEGPVGFRFPMALSGTAELVEGYDDEREVFTISVRVSHRRLGPLAGYEGTFTCTYPEAVGEAVPASARPLREELRR